MKKRLLFIVMLVLIAMAAAFAVACGNDVDEKYKVTLGYDETLGVVKVTDSDGNEATEFKAGSTVTITVAPNTGYSASEFVVNGKDAELTNNKYDFKITKNTVVNVAFEINTYTVSVDYDDYRGSVSVKDKDGNAATTFTHGDTVSVSAEAKTGFALVNFTVGGEKAALEDGACSFEITSDTNIVAAFGMDAIGQEVLDASKTNLRLDGLYEYTEQGQKPTTFTKTTVFGTDSIYLKEVQENGTVSINEAYINRGGVLTAVTHSIHNEVVYTAIQYKGEDKLLHDSPFSEYYNPFALLTPEDFELTDKADVFGLKEEKRSDASMPLTGWNDFRLARYEVTVENGKITYIEIETAKGAAVSGNLPYHSLYKFNVTEHGTAELDSDLLNPFATKPEHELLRAALMEMSVANNYTVNIIDSEVGYVDIVYNAYVTENLIYEDCEGYENGYIYMEDQKVYPFDYTPNPEGDDPKATLLDALKVESVAMLHAGFIGSYSIELFELTEDDGNNKVFTLRCDEFAGDIFQEFGDGVDKLKYYSYALNGKIILDNENKLASAVFDCYVYGSYSTVTLIYSDVGTTEAPELDFIGAKTVSMYDEYVGVYVDRLNPDFIVEITKEKGIVVDGVDAEVITYSRIYDMFVVNCGGVNLYITKKTDRQLVIYDEAFLKNEEDFLYVELVLESDEEVVIPKAYRGEWSGVCYFEQKHIGSDVAYVEATNTITCDFAYLGSCEIVGSADEKIDELTVTIDGDEFTFERAADPDQEYVGEIIPLKYTGGYTATTKIDGYDFSFILVITDDGIVFTLRGSGEAQAVITRSTATIVDNGNYELEVLSIDEEKGLVCYDENGYTYFFKLSKSGEKLFVTIADGAYLIYDNYVFGDKTGGDETIDIPAEFIGAYSYFHGSTFEEHWLIVTDSVVKLAINGGMSDAIPVDVVEVKTVAGDPSGTNMIVEYNGVEYTIFMNDEYKNTTEGRVVTVTSGTFSATFGYVDVFIGGIHEKFYGDYMSKDEQYMVCIDEDGVTILLVGDDYYEDDEITLVYADDGEIEIAAGNVTYYLGASSSDVDGNVTILWLSDEDDEIGVALYRVTE